MSGRNGGIRRHPAAVSGWPAIQLVLACVLAVGPLVVRAVSGPAAAPTDDAWAYERIFDVFHRTHDIVLVGWNDITFVGVLPIAEAWVRVVGEGPIRLHLLASVFAFVGLLVVWWWLHDLGPSRRLLGLLVVGGASGFVATTGTFMSDMFAFAPALVAVALVSGRRGGATVDVRLLVLSAVFAALAFSVRQYAVAEALGIAVVLWRTSGGRRRPLIVWTGSWLVMCVPFYVWRNSLDSGGSVLAALQPRLATYNLVAMWLTLSLTLLPLAILLPKRPFRRTTTVVGWLPALVFVPLLVLPLGRGALDAPSPLFELAVVGGPVAWIVIIGAFMAAGWSCSRVLPVVVDRWRRADPALIVAVVGVGCVTAAVAITGHYFPRYSLVHLTLLAIVMARSVDRTAAPDRGREAMSFVVAGLVMLLSVWAVERYATELASVVASASVANCAGIDDAEIDGGFLFSGWHSTGEAVSDADADPRRDALPDTEMTRIFPGLDRAAVILKERPEPGRYLVHGPLARHGMLPFTTVRTYLVVGPEVTVPDRCAPA